MKTGIQSYTYLLVSLDSDYFCRCVRVAKFHCGRIFTFSVSSSKVSKKNVYLYVFNETILRSEQNGAHIVYFLI